MGVFFRELSVLYEAFSNGKPSKLAELPIQYADYAVWQREWLKGEVLETQLSYWKKQLANAPHATNYPRIGRGQRCRHFRGARHPLVLSQDLTENSRALSRKEGVTLFMTLLAAFQTLLYRYTGQDDVIVGTPIAGRTRTEIEELIGFFVNTLVLRGDLSGNPTFRELLAAGTGSRVLEAYAHQDLPFEKWWRNYSRNEISAIAALSGDVSSSECLTGGAGAFRLGGKFCEQRYRHGKV